ncbi:MAG: hypothetical protein BWY10_02522 [Chloroflexi bacterium ADurb.Bin180]|nr:MAG: hypothetical protein BWY10_02522 [Chloroflexi bacterium ADurb.Bin180]
MAANSSHGTVAPRRWTRRFDLALVGILLLALLLRLPNLARSLWYDEVGYSAKLGAPSLWGLMRYVLNEPGSLGYRVFMFLWVQVLGENGVVLRLPSLAAGLGAVALTYALARLYVSRQSALLAVVLLALSPVHVWYSQEATPYSMALFLLLAAVYVGSRIRGGTAGRHSYGLYTLLLIAAGLVHYYSALFLLPLSILALGAEPGVRNRLWLSHAAAALWLSLPIALRLAVGTMITGMSYARPFTALEWWMLCFNWFLDGNSIWPLVPYSLARLGGWKYLLGQPALVACQLAALALLVRGLLLSPQPEPAAVAGTVQPGAGSGAQHPRPAWELGLYLLCSPLILLALTLVGYNRLYIERFLVVLLPFFWILVARGAAEGLGRRWRVVLVVAVLAFATVAYACLLAKSDQWTVYKPNPDWSRAVDYLLEDRAADEHDLVLIAVPSWDLQYALSVQRTGPVPSVRDVRPQEVDAVLPEYPGARVYLIDEWFWHGNFDAVKEELSSAPELRLASERSFKGLTIYEYLPR